MGTGRVLSGDSEQAEILTAPSWGAWRWARVEAETADGATTATQTRDGRGLELG